MRVTSGSIASSLAPKLLQRHQSRDRVDDLIFYWHSPLCILIIFEYSQEYFQPNIGRKIRIFSLGRKNNIFLLEKECNFVAVRSKETVGKSILKMPRR